MKPSIYLRNKWHKSSTICLYCFKVCVCINIMMSYDHGICFIFLRKQNTSDNVVLELKCDRLVKILQVLHTLPDLYIIC